MNINNINISKLNTAKWSIHIGIRVNPIRRECRQMRRFPARVTAEMATEKPSTCTADELHYVSIPNTHWHLALWRYLPSSTATVTRNHPLLLLSGVGNNAIGYDLSPQFSFARHMSGQGFDTWILEVRGAGLSKRLGSFQRFSDTTQASVVGSQISNLGQWVSEFAKVQTSFPLRFPQLNERLTSMIEEFQRQLDLFENSDWDLDQLVKEDLPMVLEYIRAQSKPRDGKLLAIGHSMGGILLYATLSLCGFEGRDSGLAAVTTLASSLDFSSSRSSLKLLLPLIDPAVALKVPAIPLGAVIAAIHPFASCPPFRWLNTQISAQEMMDSELLERIVLKNFCTVPAKLLLQLGTTLISNGLSDRNRTFFYKEHLHKTNVPILALAGDQDLVCPPDAVYETIKKISEHMITYRVFGEPSGPHYAHYDLVGGRFASKQVYPCIIKFLSTHDKLVDGTQPRQ